MRGPPLAYPPRGSGRPVTERRGGLIPSAGLAVNYGPAIVSGHQTTLQPARRPHIVPYQRFLGPGGGIVSLWRIYPGYADHVLPEPKGRGERDVVDGSVISFRMNQTSSNSPVKTIGRPLRPFARSSSGLFSPILVERGPGTG